jgi:hypothetical protein
MVRDRGGERGRKEHPTMTERTTERKPVTAQKIYAVLRSNGYRGKNSSSRWPVVSKDSDTYRIWYNVTWESYEGQRSIPAQDRRETIYRMWLVLKQAGVTGIVSEDGLIIRIDE